MSAAVHSNPEHLIGVIDALPPAETRPRRMLDRYEVIAQIAKGGMGTVYLARREGAGGFERLSAIKVLHEHLAEDDTFVQMLLDEARTAAHIHHPNAIGIDDVAESTVGHYLVMAYVDGFNLAQIMTEPTLGETERIRMCSRLIVDAANGLHAAHTAKNAKGEKLGIVHRDVSPQNVLVGTDGTGRIVDFGIALAASRVLASRPGTLKGKPQYMAPEQARGEPCDARTDVFALGVVLWEVLTLERLFYGEMDVAILVQVMDCIVPDPRERNPRAPAGLAEIAMKALSKSPDARYASAREMAAAIEKLGSTHVATTAEVEETLSRVFAVDIALKAEAVRRHLESSTGTAEPLQKGQLALIPRLLPKELAPKRNDLATRTDRPRVDVPSGVRSRTGDVSAPRIEPASHERAVEPTGPTLLATPIPPVAARPAPATASTPPTTGRVGIVLAIVGILLLIGAGLVWVMGGDAPPPSVAGAPTSDATPPPSSVALEPPPSAVVPTTAVPTTALPTTAVPTTALPTTTVATTDGVVAEVPSTVVPDAVEATEVPAAVVAPPTEHGHHHGHATPPPTSSAPTTTVTAPPSTGTGMTIETNPYLSH